MQKNNFQQRIVVLIAALSIGGGFFYSNVESDGWVLIYSCLVAMLVGILIGASINFKK